MIDKQQRISQLINRCNSRIDIASKYIVDNEFSPDDYSFEYAVSDLLYDASIVKRSLLDFDDEIKQLFNNVKNLTAHFDSKLWPRIIKLHHNYFSEDEFDRQLDLIHSAHMEKDNEYWESALSELFERKDKLDLFSDGSSFFSECLEMFYKADSSEHIAHYKNLKDGYTNKLKKSIQETEAIGLLSVGIRISMRQLNLIPNNETYNWWYEVNTLTEEDLNMTFQLEIDKERVKDLLNTAVPDEYKKCREDGFDYIINQQPEIASFLSTISQPQVISEYKSWSADTPIPSDHRIFDEALRNAPGVDKAIIEDLIEAILLEDMDPERKKNILASAYFIIGKISEAIKLLSNEK